MTPFEHLIHELGEEMDLSLHPDTNQSCLLSFPQDDLSIQIDLAGDADQVLIGCQLGGLTAGTYRERVLSQALRVNGTSEEPRGILAFSEKNETLILFQFLTLAFLNGQKLYKFLQLFLEHAKVWKEALIRGELPLLVEPVSYNRPFGL